MRKDALIRLDELDTERAQLIEQARSEILQTINDAIDQLEGLGFSYTLVEQTGANGVHRQIPSRTKARARGTANKRSQKTASKRANPKGTRRTGIRQDVLAAIAASGKNGMTRGELIAEFRANDDSFKQSISNALVALKKQKQVKATKGVYKAAA